MVTFFPCGDVHLESTMSSFLRLAKAHISSTLIVITIAVPTSAQVQKHMADLEKTKTTMRKLYELDQSHHAETDRSKYREQVQELMRSGKVQSAKDYYYAAFIFQHGQKPSDYLYAHVLAVTAVNKGLHAAIWISAATLDRYLQSVEQPQIFGTQLGDGQEPYDRKMLSDEIRAMWCVAPQVKQSQILADERAGKGFHSTRTPRTCPLPDAQFDTQ